MEAFEFESKMISAGCYFLSKHTGLSKKTFIAPTDGDLAGFCEDVIQNTKKMNAPAGEHADGIRYPKVCLLRVWARFGDRSKNFTELR